MKHTAWAIAALLTFSLVGCTTTFSSTNGKLSYAEVKGTEVGPVMASSRAVYLFSPSFISLAKPQEQLDKVIEPKLPEGANAVKDLKVVLNHDILWYFSSALTGGLIGVPNVEVTGTAITQ